MVRCIVIILFHVRGLAAPIGLGVVVFAWPKIRLGLVSSGGVFNFLVRF
jgi:hypothetical protein